MIPIGNREEEASTAEEGTLKQPTENDPNNINSIFCLRCNYSVTLCLFLFILCSYIHYYDRLASDDLLPLRRFPNCVWLWYDMISYLDKRNLICMIVVRTKSCLYCTSTIILCSVSVCTYMYIAWDGLVAKLGLLTKELGICTAALLSMYVLYSLKRTWSRFVNLCPERQTS